MERWREGDKAKMRDESEIFGKKEKKDFLREKPWRKQKACPQRSRARMHKDETT